MTREWIVENTWNCTSCGAVNQGRFDACQTCAHQKDKGEIDNPVTGSESAVTDPELLRKAKAGPNALCQFCDGQVRLVNDKCPTCGAVCAGDKDEVRIVPTERAYLLLARVKAQEEQTAREARARADTKPNVPLAPPAAPAPTGTSPFRPLYVGEDGTRTGTLIGFYWWLVRRSTRRPVRAVLTVLAVLATLLTTGIGRTLRFCRAHWVTGAVVIGLGVLAAFLFWLFLPRQVEVTVSAATWEWRADLRQKTLEHGESWDDQMPSDAFNRQCSTRQRGTERCNRHACGSHPENYTCGSHSCNCGTSCTSNKNGFSTCRQSCSTCPDTCTKQVTDYCWDECPVYDTWCAYDYYDWPIIQTASTAGECLEEPRWPPLAANGPEQRVDHHETYRVGFANAKQQTWTIHPATLVECRRYRPGVRWLIKVNRIGQVWPLHLIEHAQ